MVWRAYLSDGGFSEEDQLDAAAGFGGGVGHGGGGGGGRVRGCCGAEGTAEIVFGQFGGVVEVVDRMEWLVGGLRPCGVIEVQ